MSRYLTLCQKSWANQNKSPMGGIFRDIGHGAQRDLASFLPGGSSVGAGFLRARFPHFQFGNGQRCKETGIGVYDASEASEYAIGFSQDVMENFHSGPLMCYADSGMAKGIDVVPEKLCKSLGESRQWGIQGSKPHRFRVHASIFFGLGHAICSDGQARRGVHSDFRSQRQLQMVESP